MKKIKFIYYVICLSLVTTTIWAQGVPTQTSTWNDGNPVFQKNSIINNVRVDSVVSFIATSGFSEESPGFQFILPVIDSSWVWPDSPNQVKITSAVDIEYYTAKVNQDTIIHYVVTDRDGGKIIDLVLSNPDRAWTLDMIGSDKLNNPTDTYVYKENGNPIFLITEQGRNRVIKYDRIGDMVLWQFGGPTSNALLSPSDAVALPDTGQVLICDTGNHRLLLVNAAGTVLDTLGLNILKRPVDIEYDFNTKEILITDQGNNRVIKLNSQTRSITWEYNVGLNFPTDADLLPNGNVLISDGNNQRLIEVNMNKEIVWQLETPLENLEDADRLGVQLGSNWINKHLVISNGQPSLIGYITREFISQPPKNLNVEVAYDSLLWSAKTIPGVTSIQMQLRTESNSSDLISSAPWRGPTEDVVFYTNPASQINPLHNGHKFYQFKATLQTSDPLYTPVLNNVKVTYKYYNTETTGQIVSNVISGSEDSIITKWKSIKFNTILPPNPANRDKVRIEVKILDGLSGDTLRTFTANPFNTINEEALDNIEGLKLKQSIKLFARFNTISSAATPILNDWEVSWEAIAKTPAQIDFVKLLNQEFKPTSYYRAPKGGQDYIDYVNVKLTDPNLIPIQQSINLTVSSVLSLDSELITLSLQPEGWYLSGTSLPAVIADTVISNDGILQVYDRDHLVVSYTDPMVPSDQASDTALMVQNTEGIIEFLVRDVEGDFKIQNEFYTKIDSAQLGDTIYVHITGEKDRDLTPQQDKFPIVVFNYETTDEETLSVAEVPDTLLNYDTGEFISTGLRVIASSTPVFGDTLLQAFAGSRISVKYDETISRIPIIKVYGGKLPIPIEPYAGIRSLDFDIAPNPYYGDRHDILRIRVASSVGDLTVEKIEIYNFAGQKITEIDGSRLEFYYSYPIPAEQYSYADNWWNLSDQGSVPVSSGTYWVKVLGNSVNSNKRFSHVKKFVIIR